jgi:hypothetical protein
MNEIEKLIQTTRTEHDKTKPAANFWVTVAVVGNVVIPILLIGGLVLAFCLLK